MRIIVKRPGRFRRLERTRRDELQLSARPSPISIPRNRNVGHGGIRRIQLGRTRPNLICLWANWPAMQSPFGDNYSDLTCMGILV